ncbi:hypothetical protein ACFXI6_55495 [Streptomyces mirabilis]|uniref:hypothetical protein n=1 Tax=Streptomyces mirabilis TaxID=68239 RepID=UPI0036958AC6
MTIRSDHSASVDQIYRALVALGAEPVLDPELRPEGPQEEDRLRMLGALLAKAELEITAATRLGIGDGAIDIADTLAGWMEHTGPTVGMSVLLNRLERTAVQLVGPAEEGEPPAGRAASSAAVVAAAGMLGAHMVSKRADAEVIRLTLDRTEASVIALLEGIHQMRVAIGDVEGY